MTIMALVSAFVAESTLGKLAKWLRLAGFDTLLDSGVPDESRLARMATPSRVILTRTVRIYRAMPAGRALFIKPDNPEDQIRQVLTEACIGRNDVSPMSRCLLCNEPLSECRDLDMVGLVPEYVRQTHRRFRCCPQCGRTYWAGSHAERIRRRIAAWFGDQDAAP